MTRTFELIFDRRLYFLKLQLPANPTGKRNLPDHRQALDLPSNLAPEMAAASTADAVMGQHLLERYAVSEMRQLFVAEPLKESPSSSAHRQCIMQRTSIERINRIIPGEDHAD
jgi:hypothetical protein